MGEEIKQVGTEQQEQAQQPKEEEKPEFALTEGGELVVNDGEDVVAVNAYGDAKEEAGEDTGEKPTEEPKEEVGQSSEGEEKTEKQDKEDFIQPENEYYTKEEIEKIGIDKLDPKKIPEELVPFYKSMQADYTRKTQRLAEERKKLEAAKAEIERQARLIEMQAQTNLPLETLRKLMEETKAEVRAALGDNFDEFDPETQSIIQGRMAERVQLYKQQQIAQQKLEAAEQHLRQVDPLFPQVEVAFRYLVENELSLKEIEALRAAQRVGDPVPFLEVYNTARERVLSILEQQQQQQGAQNQTGFTEQQTPAQGNLGGGQSDSKSVNVGQSQQKKEPPQVENAGGRDPQKAVQKKISPRDLAGRSTDEQASLLIQMGLV